MVFRRFILPLLYHHNHVDDESTSVKGDWHHIVDWKGQVLDPSGQPLGNVFLGPDGRVVDSFGTILPGDVYTLDGNLIKTPLFGYSVDPVGNFLRDIVGRRVPGYSVIRGPDGVPVSNVSVAPNHQLLPLNGTMPVLLNSTENIASSTRLPPTTVCLNSSQPKIAHEESTSLTPGKQVVGKEHPFSLEGPSPISTNIQEKIPSVTEGQTIAQGVPIMPGDWNKTLALQSCGFRPNFSEAVSYFREPEHRTNDTSNTPTERLYPASVEEDQSNYLLSKRSRPFSPRYQATLYIVDSEGRIVRGTDFFPLEGFTAGPYRTVIGPDGRPLIGTRIAENGRQIQVEDSLAVKKEEEETISVVMKAVATEYLGETYYIITTIYTETLTIIKFLLNIIKPYDAFKFKRY